MPSFELNGFEMDQRSHAKKRRRDDGTPMKESMDLKMASPRTKSIHLSGGHDTDVIHTTHSRLLAKPKSVKRQRLSGDFNAEALFLQAHDGSIVDIYGNPTQIIPTQSKSQAEIRGDVLGGFSDGKPIGKIDLSACHVCRRKPGGKGEMDQYADCESCGDRTCWICIRECSQSQSHLEDHRMDISFGMDDELVSPKTKVFLDGRGSDHQRRICSRCCVEKGSEGEVWCLGCLRAEEGG